MLVIKRPYITERSSALSEQNIYCFEVGKNSNKPEIAKAVGILYKVKPTSIRIVNLPAKKIMRGNKIGRGRAIKKAYVKFPVGTKIEFV